MKPSLPRDQYLRESTDAGDEVRHTHDPASGVDAPSEEEREVEALRARVARLEEAVEALTTTGIECFEDGSRVAPREGCECNTCESMREGLAALSEAKRLGVGP